MAETMDIIAPKASDEAEPIVVTVTMEIVQKEKRVAESLSVKGVEIRDGRAVIVDSEAMLEDKDGRKAVHEQGKKLVKMRTTAKEEFKVIKEPHLRICQALDENHRKIQAAIVEAEKPLILIEEAYEKELDRIAQEKLDRIYHKRVEILIQAGAEKIHLDERTIRGFDEDQFVKHLAYVEEFHKQKLAEEAERQRIAEEQRIERERLLEERRKLEEANRIEQEKLRAAQEELRKQREETERQLEEGRRKLAEQQAETERIRREQEHAAEMARLAEENRIAAERLQIERQQQEIEEKNRLHQLEVERLEAERLEMEHAREAKPILEEVEKIQEFESHVMDPYRSMRTPFDWHVSAGEAIARYFGHEDNDSINAVAEIILDFDPLGK